MFFNLTIWINDGLQENSILTKFWLDFINIKSDFRSSLVQEISNSKLFLQIINFVKDGGYSLKAYEEFSKIKKIVMENLKWLAINLLKNIE